MTAYYIAFGPHGPRALPPPGEGKKIFGYTIIGLLISFGVFTFARMMARPPPATMTKEYQEKTNEYLRVRTPYLHSHKSPHIAHPSVYATDEPC
jgi:cytochrome c oxidase subunit 4